MHTLPLLSRQVRGCTKRSHIVRTAHTSCCKTFLKVFCRQKKFDIIQSHRQLNWIGGHGHLVSSYGRGAFLQGNEVYALINHSGENFEVK